MELIGFVTEGIHRSVGRQGRTSYDSLTFAITYEDFLRLTRRRGGHLWPGEVAIARMLETLSDRDPHATRVDALLTQARREHDQWLADLDARHVNRG